MIPASSVRASRHRFLIASALVALTVLFCSILGPNAAGAGEPDIVMWGHPGCPHCRAAHGYLDALRARRPDLVIVEHDVSTDPAALEDLNARTRRAGLDMVGVPSFAVGGDLLVGFESPETTGRAIEARLQGIEEGAGAHGPAHAVGSDEVRVPVASDPTGDGIAVPWVGRVSARDLGLPLFTIAIGLIDGFNPCAMWVLLFLLALLVNVHDRKRMLAIAGSFVVVSGVAYYAFMAAWLNVFLLVGLSRVVQVGLGLLAVVVGVVHVKDFFALGRGVSLSIPESAKPGIYARVRAIVRAESLFAAIIGAVVLAVMVNVIELLCTAGLPALYTQVLAQHSVGPTARYGYLLLYILAYMLDDSIMVGVAVVTLGRRKLQERAGRWLKLLSGATILVLGLLLVFAPSALVW
jgi:glutaredoxin